MRLLRGCVAFAALLGSSPAGAATSDLEEHRALVVSAQVLQRNGKLLRSREIFTTCATDLCPTDQAGAVECERIRTFCAERGARLDADVPTVRPVVVDDRGAAISAAQIRVDIEHVAAGASIALDPGHHVVRGEYAGRVATGEVEVRAGQKDVIVRLVMDLRTDVAVRPTPWPVFALSITSGVALVSGIAFGLAAQGQRADAEFCKPTCDPSGASAYRFKVTATDVTFSAGVVTGLGALIWYLARPTVHRTERLGAPGSGGRL